MQNEIKHIRFHIIFLFVFFLCSVTLAALSAFATGWAYCFQDCDPQQGFNVTTSLMVMGMFTTAIVAQGIQLQDLASELQQKLAGKQR